MRKRIEVPLDKVKKCIELHSDGWNFTKIGKEVGLDRRIVAKIVRSRQEAERLEQVAAARRDIAASYFRKHIEDIEVARRYLLEIIAPPSMRIGIHCLTTNVAEELLSLLNKLFVARRRHNFFSVYRDFMIEDEIAMTEPHQRILYTRTGEREAKETLEGLKEHLPPLWPKVKAWEQAAERYNARLGNEFEELKELAGKLGIESSVKVSAIGAALKLILDEGYPSEEEEFSPAEYRSNLVVGMGDRLRRIPLLQRCLNILVSSWCELEQTFEEIENMISPSQLHKALITSHCQFCPVP
ncbi:MAG: hypothetical protein FJ006_08670 [Chloroflexi bacterium]|nr:hypothetical protein [Chloroflexota bacterium]